MPDFIVKVLGFGSYQGA